MRALTIKLLMEADSKEVCEQVGGTGDSVDKTGLPAIHAEFPLAFLAQQTRAKCPFFDS